MPIDRTTAAASLADIAEAEHRTFQAVFRGFSSVFLSLWGAVTLVGYLVTQFQPSMQRWAWPLLQVAGLAASVAILWHRQRARPPGRTALAWRLFAAMLFLVAFGILFVVVFGPFNSRQLNTFWPTVFALGYALAGLWAGGFFIGFGIALTAASVAGYWWAGPWFGLWMAAFNGGGLVLAGWWLNRSGATR